PNGLPRGTTRLGMLLLLAADAMVLVVLLVAYFTIRGGSPKWPASGVQVGTYIPTVLSVTAVMSALSVAWMLSATRQNDQRNAFAAAVLTVVLGLAMANAQWYAMTNAGFGPADHAYGTLYHLLLGYHLAHLLAGLAMVGVVAAQTLAGHYSREDHEPVRAAATFWQYGNVVWFTVLTVLFLLTPHAQK
ncbi:MAG TPA: cytochrome c oxidase subunit 3, partial [Acidimicrobiales bacterium]|nr:cytochrome c oxidase subunit 3 [Acidimicrobiales bacterium]